MQHFVHHDSTKENPKHDRNYSAFTLDFPDAAQPSIGVSIHPLSNCFCRYMVKFPSFNLCKCMINFSACHDLRGRSSCPAAAS